MGNLLGFVGSSFRAHSWKWLLFGVILTLTHLLLAVPFVGLLVLWLILPWMQLGAATFLHRSGLGHSFEGAGDDAAEHTAPFSDFFAGIHKAPGLIGLATINGLALLGFFSVQMTLFFQDPALRDAFSELVGMQETYVLMSTEEQMRVVEELGILELMMAGHGYEMLALALLTVVWLGMTFTAPYRLALEGHGVWPSLVLSFKDGANHWWLPLVVGVQGIVVLTGMLSVFFLLPLLLPLVLIFGFAVYQRISNESQPNGLAQF
jgi:hypothetical protein